MKHQLQNPLEWISEAVYIYGFISPEHLLRKYTTSKVQAIQLLEQFQRAKPGVLIYNPAKRHYERSYEPRRKPKMEITLDAKKKANERKSAKRKAERQAKRSRLEASLRASRQPAGEGSARSLQ